MLMQDEVYCCDADALIDLANAGFIKDLRKLALLGRLKIPGAVTRDLRKRSDLGKRIAAWKTTYGVVLELDLPALTLLPDIETKYGNGFNIGGMTYPGLWAGPRARKSADAQVIALAKARAWTVISNDKSVHGACALEDVPCRRWEEVTRALRSL
ncbi:MAG: hypothetical protein ACE5JL_12400 [Dehalococcoidia bacterium]